MRRPTARQLEIHDWMLEYQEANGAPPALREIGAHFRIGSLNGVSDHLRALERRGLVRHYKGRARGWVALAEAVAVSDAPQPARGS